MKNWHARQLGTTSKKVLTYVQAITRTAVCVSRRLHVDIDLKTTSFVIIQPVLSRSHDLIHCVRNDGCGEQRLYVEIPEQLMHLTPNSPCA